MDALHDAEGDDLDDDIAASTTVEAGYPERLEELVRIVELTSSLWRRRLELGLSVTEVARRLGVDPDVVERVEDNDVSAPADLLARYAATLGLSLDYRLLPA